MANTFTSDEQRLMIDNQEKIKSKLIDIEIRLDIIMEAFGNLNPHYWPLHDIYEKRKSIQKSIDDGTYFPIPPDIYCDWELPDKKCNNYLNIND